MVRRNSACLSPKAAYRLERLSCVASHRSSSEVALYPLAQKTRITSSSTTSGSNSRGRAIVFLMRVLYRSVQNVSHVCWRQGYPKRDDPKIRGLRDERRRTFPATCPTVPPV